MEIFPGWICELNGGQAAWRRSVMLAFATVSLFGGTLASGVGAEPIEFALPAAAPGEAQSSLLTDSPGDWRQDFSAAKVWSGDGFEKGTLESGAMVGYGPGNSAFGSRQAHHFVLTKLHLGRMMSGVLGADHWYGGNVELVGELFAGGQVDPKGAYVVGVTPLLRYNFATGTRLVPFLEGGAGVTLTDVGLPDLSTRFEFNSQAGAGVHWLLNPRVAVTLQGRFAHLSNADIKRPNFGVNFSVFYGGLTWFF